MLQLLNLYWPPVLVLLTLAISIPASCHAMMYKRDPRASIAWVGFIWFVPLLGSLLYLWLGINRIRRKARALRPHRQVLPPPPGEHRTSPEEETVQRLGLHLPELAKVVARVTGNPLLSGNRVEPLCRQDAYARMLSAIDESEQSVTLTTYIFDNDEAGRRFLRSLSGALARGVEVRVIVDHIGAQYSWPSIVRPLRQAGIPLAVFMRKVSPRAFPYSNLRNHRKILVVDGRLGFTGGMNIRAGHDATIDSSSPVDDLHFQTSGPVVAQLQQAFAEDWYFCKREKLEGTAWFPELSPDGTVLARGIPDGPDEDFDNLRTTILAALACAESSVRIVTPYFIPDMGMITALNLAAMRGVAVEIVLPEKNNLRLVQWASTALLWQVLEQGCRVWLSPPPFDHTKLMVVDGGWTMLGSSNWDPRSLRLNFEFNVECYDAPLASAMHELVEQKIARSRQLTQQHVDARPFPIRLRDSAARLLSPYL